MKPYLPVKTKRVSSIDILTVDGYNISVLPINRNKKGVTMTRIRTHRTTKYYTASNATAQDPDLSFEALGLLSYCLSMPSDWEFKPKVIAKEKKCGRDKTYRLFNDLIKTYHCIRIKKLREDPRMKHLPGKVEYEIFDDVEDCKARIKELENSEDYIEHGDNLKKCLRRTENQDLKMKDIEKTYNTKETENTKETKYTKETPPYPPNEPPVLPDVPPNISSSGGGGFKEDLIVENTKGKKIHVSGGEIFNHFLKSGYSTEIIKKAIEIARNEKNPITDPLRYLESVCLRLNKTQKPVKLEKKEKPEYGKHVPLNTEKGITWAEFHKLKEKEKNEI